MTPTDYWRDCGHCLLEVNQRNHLVVTDAYLAHLLDRPELAPVETSCQAEHDIFSQLLEQPRAQIDPQSLSRIKNIDVADNLRVWMRFRDRLLACATLEESYTALFRGGKIDVPPMLIDEVVQVLTRHILGPTASAIDARIAELFFRTQSVSINKDSAILAADAQTIASVAAKSGFGALGKLLRGGGISLASDNLTVLTTDNQSVYWSREGLFDMAISLNRAHHGMTSLCQLIEKWVLHFLDVAVTVRALGTIEDDRWAWHAGLDAQSSGMLNDLYLGKALAPSRRERLLSLFTLIFNDPSQMLTSLQGRPVYMAIAIDEARQLRLKPQNLLLNLPLAAG